MSFSLKPIKPLPNPASTIVGTVDFEKVLEGYMQSGNTVLDATASADTQTVVAPTIPLQTTHTEQIPLPPVDSTTPNRFQDFTISENQQTPSSDGFVPLQLDISDIENDPSLTEELKARLIKERTDALQYKNYILKLKHDEKMKFTQQHEKLGQIWLDKITPAQADQSQMKANAQGIRKLLAAALLNLNDENDLKMVSNAIEATASVLTENSSRSTQLEKIYQENQTLKREVENLKSTQYQQQQALKNQTSLVSPVKSLATPVTQPGVNIKAQLAQLDSYGRTVYEGFLKQNVSKPDPVRDLNLALQAQQLANQHSSVPQDATYRQIYGDKIFENIKRVKTGL